MGNRTPGEEREVRSEHRAGAPPAARKRRNGERVKQVERGMGKAAALESRIGA